MGCDHNCENCASKENCGEIEKAKLNDRSNIKRIVAILSGKGGVGKSFTTSLLAVNLAKKGYKVGILDADITGPSIGKVFGVKEKAMGEDSLIYPFITKSGIKIITANMLLENDNEPIVWRGIMLGNLVKQFYSDVLWEELDYLLIDMPPGTGDIALSTFQLLPVDDLIIVTSPQDLVSMVVGKAIKMARIMNINVLGVVENMSFVKCPDCNKTIKIFGESHLNEFAKDMDFKIIGQLPLDPKFVSLADSGSIEDVDMKEFETVVNAVEGK